MTTTVEECPHGGDPHACRPCQRAAEQGHGPALADPAPRPRTFPARFPGNCAECSALILEGDEIAPAEDGPGYLCPVCIEEL